MSWSAAIQATNQFEDEEIGINSQVAEGWGLREGISISCSVIQNVSPLKSINIALSEEDYQMAELSTERIQNELLEQIAVVARYQSFVIWLNKSISVKAVVGMLFFAHFSNPTRMIFFRLLLNTELASSIFRQFKSIF